MRTLFSIALVLLLSALIPLPAQGQAPRDPVASLDGTLTRLERLAATDSLKEAGSAIFVRRAGDMLWVAVESDPIGVASLCVGSEEEVRVLHASAALGMLRFYPRGSRWHTEERFTWSVRDTTMSSAAIAERRAYLDENGWVATTNAMGHATHTEFLIRYDRLPAGELFLSVGIMPSERPGGIHGLPASRAGACASEDLVRGVVPTAAVTFDPASWKAIAD